MKIFPRTHRQPYKPGDFIVADRPPANLDAVTRRSLFGLAQGTFIIRPDAHYRINERQLLDAKKNTLWLGPAQLKADDLRHPSRSHMKSTGDEKCSIQLFQFINR
jgi:hypothetical protein